MSKLIKIGSILIFSIFGLIILLASIWSISKVVKGELPNPTVMYSIHFFGFVFRGKLYKWMAPLRSKFPQFPLYLLLVALFDIIVQGAFWLSGYKWFEGAQLWEVLLLLPPGYVLGGLALYLFYKKFNLSTTNTFIIAGVSGVLWEIPKVPTLWGWPIWATFLYAIISAADYSFQIALPLWLVRTDAIEEGKPKLKIKISLLAILTILIIAYLYFGLTVGYVAVFHPGKLYRYQNVTWNF